MSDSEKPTPQPTLCERLSVLLIVQDRLLGGDLALTLEEIGYRVIFTPDGEASAPALASLPDLVVIDAAGGEQADALEFGERIGRLLGRPIVYLVDNAEQASRVDEQSAGASLVQWPFLAVALKAALSRALATGGNRPSS